MAKIIAQGVLNKHF